MARYGKTLLWMLVASWVGVGLLTWAVIDAREEVRGLRIEDLQREDLMEDLRRDEDAFRGGFLREHGDFPDDGF